VHTHYATLAQLGIKHSGAKADEAVITDIGRSMDQSHMGNRGVVADPNGILLAVIANHPAFFQAVNYHPVLDVGVFANEKGGALISPDRCARGDQHIGSNVDIADDVGKGMHIGGVVDFGFGETFRPRGRGSRETTNGHILPSIAETSKI
jgi:hypothetical protein